MNVVLSEIAQSLRALTRSPGTMLMVALTLGVAMGANGLLFGLISETLLRPLPYQEPEQLVVIWSTNAARGTEQASVSAPDFADFRMRARSFEAIVAMRRNTFTIRGMGEPQEVKGALVSERFFELFGLKPVLGRYFSPAEHQQEHGGVVVLGHDLWRRSFGGDPRVVGREVLVDDRARLVIGIAPPELHVPSGAEMWSPLSFRPESAPRGDRYLVVLGRLHPGNSLKVAHAELRNLARGLARDFPDTNEGWSVSLVSLGEQLVQPVRAALLILFVAVWLILAIACVNVANILLVRGLARRREFAVRIALGAGWWQVIRLSLCESLILALAGGVLGMVLQSWAIGFLNAHAAGFLPRFHGLSIDTRISAYNFGLMALVGVVCGLLPFLHLLKSRVYPSLQVQTQTEFQGSRKLQDLAVVAQVTMTFTLLVGSMLLLKSFYFLQRVDPGFDSHGVSTLRISLSSARYENAQVRRDYFHRVLERVEALPGVEAAGFVSDLPLGGSTWTSSFAREGAPPPAPDEVPTADIHSASARYFTAMRIGFVKGRAFEAADSARRGVAVINQAALRRYWPDVDPIGRRLIIGGPAEDVLFGGPLEREVVGVVEDVRHHGLSEASRPEIYIPLEQDLPPSTTLVVRSGPQAPEISGFLRQAVASVDRDQPIGEVRPLDDIVASSLKQKRLQAFLLGSFALLSLLLASIGIYAVVAYSAARRSREIGLRLAMGAQRSTIVVLFLGLYLRLTLVGILLGAVLSLWGMRVLAHSLYLVRPSDGSAYIAAASILALVALLASLQPSVRSMRVDPAIALREP